MPRLKLTLLKPT